MTDLYIKTPTQTDYDALIRLAEAVGYEWYSKHNPTDLNCYTNHNEQSVVKLADDRKLLSSSVKRFELEGRTIETIPNLADIKAIWNVKPKYKNAFNDEKLDTSDIFKDWVLDDSVIILLENGSYDLGFKEIYKALAVEYKPKESEEVMSEKVKFPKEIFEALKEYGMPNYPDSADFYPLTELYSIDRFRHNPEAGEAQRVLGEYLRSNIDNQWKLIDALRYGYESEPEPRWGIKAGNCYMKDPENCGFDNIASQEAAYWTVKSAADAMIKMLGFGEVVDLNKEDKADE